MKARWACLHERDRAWLGLNEQQIVGQENLAFAIPAILPFAFSRGEIKADKDAIVQTKGAAVTCDDVVVSCLQILVLPDFADRKFAVSGARHPQERCRILKAGREQDTITVQRDGLRALRPFVAPPSIVPELATVFGVVTANVRRVDRENLTLTAECGNARGRETGLITAGLPCHGS